jgi:hypothetical protein
VRKTIKNKVRLHVAFYFLLIQSNIHFAFFFANPMWGGGGGGGGYFTNLIIHFR